VVVGLLRRVVAFRLQTSVGILLLYFQVFAIPTLTKKFNNFEIAGHSFDGLQSI
jgi:hypothetical protein